MFSSGSRLSFSKLKVLSGLLNCSVSSLKSLQTFQLSHPQWQSNFPWPLYSCYKYRFFSSDNFAESSFGTAVDIKAITNGDAVLSKKMKVIILEAEVMRQEGLKVPSKISDEKWEELLNAPSKSQRTKLLAFWWLNEKKRESTKQKKEIARLKKKESLENDDNLVSDHIQYGLGGSTIFLRIYDQAIDNLYNRRLVEAMLFGQDLVIDCSYDEYMNSKESSLCSSQIKILFSENRLKRDPFNIHFCNVNKEGPLFSKLLKHIPTMLNEEFPMNISEKSYLDKFPKEKLVYLTPHCREELKYFSHDDVYIIGAMVDKVNNDPLSLGKAKSLGLRMARLPLERYLDWGIGGKSLTLNQMLLILHELKATGDWRKALDFVPKRKIKGIDFEKKYSNRKRPLNIKNILTNY